MLRRTRSLARSRRRRLRVLFSGGGHNPEKCLAKAAPVWPARRPPSQHASLRGIMSTPGDKCVASAEIWMWLGVVFKHMFWRHVRPPRIIGYFFLMWGGHTASEVTGDRPKFPTKLGGDFSMGPELLSGASALPQLGPPEVKI